MFLFWECYGLLVWTGIVMVVWLDGDYYGFLAWTCITHSPEMHQIRGSTFDKLLSRTLSGREFSG